MKSRVVAIAALALVAVLAGCGSGGSGHGVAVGSQPQVTILSTGPQGQYCLSAGTPPRITWTTVPLRDTGTPRPTQLNTALSWEQYVALHARSVDSAPVTIAQAFPRRPVLASAGCGWPGIPNINYATRDYARVDSNCGAAVWGGAIKRALHQAGCSQALRAAYRTDVGGYVGLMELLNLRDSVAASQVATLLAPGSVGLVAHPGSNGFLLPLDPPAWLTVLGKGYSEANVYIVGHYVLALWVARADGEKPSDDTWNLGQLRDLLDLPSAFAKRGSHIPPVVVHIFASRGHPSRCVMPAVVPRFSSLNLILTGNTTVTDEVPTEPGTIPGGMKGTVRLGSIGGANSSQIIDNLTVFSKPGTYYFHVWPAPKGPCKLVVR